MNLLEMLMPDDADPPAEPLAVQLVLDAFTMFYRGKGVVSFTEWSQLPGWARAIAARAAELVEREHAALVGLAVSGPEGYARVVAPLDNGLEAERQENDELHEILMAQANASNPGGAA